MSLQISVRQIGPVTVIDLAGRLTLGEASSSIREKIRSLLAEGNKNLLANLADVSYVDSSGLGEFVGAYATVRNQGGSLKLMNLQNKINQLLQITKLYTVFEIYNDEATALRSFEKGTAAGQ